MPNTKFNSSHFRHPAQPYKLPQMTVETSISTSTSTSATAASPWFPNSTVSTDPCVTSTPARSAGMIFRRSPRDADDFEPRSIHADVFDTLELQDDSFVTFSVGNLERRNFSVLGITRTPRFTRESFSDADASSRYSSDRANRRTRFSRKRARRPADRPVLTMMRCFY